MPTGSTIAIKIAGVNVTSYVLPSTCRFESQLNAVAGTWQFTLKDVDHTLGPFETGSIMDLTVDGTQLYLGFLLQVSRTYPFPAMDTVNTPPDETPRYWTLRGVDFNRLFDKRVLRNPADFYHQLPNFPSTSMDGDLIQQLCDDFLDLDGLVDYTTHVENIRPPFEGQDEGAWLAQGTPWRKQMEDFAQFSGAVWYLGPKNATTAYLWYKEIEDAVHRWGFSDNPNYNSISASPTSFQGATIGPREIEATEAGDHMVNDALIWGGSSWAGGTGGIVFARETNATSITEHGRWQYAEVHIGEEGYKLQEGVDVRADVIVNGPPGAVDADQQRGLRYPQWNVRLTWFAHQVPTISGVPDHLYPGALSTIELQVFEDGDPLTLLLPCRQITITIPSLDPNGDGYVQFGGFFGLQPDDPYTLWRFLLKAQRTAQQALIAVVDENSDATQYGAIGNFIPTPAPNGSATVFTCAFGYIAGTTRVYLKPAGSTGGGLLLYPGLDYTESDPIAGQITLNVAPATGSQLMVNCRTLGS
ncbi:MAG TPA: hypothetical protein VFX15_02950 [Actinomycetes bacterium]|nr:hypothetical protein [Actinomycetes bacterium]